MKEGRVQAPPPPFSALSPLLGTFALCVGRAEVAFKTRTGQGGRTAVSGHLCLLLATAEGGGGEGAVP